MRSTPVYKCLYCDEEFSKKFDFFEHKNIHSGETPFKCISCEKNFNLLKHYVNHIKIQYCCEHNKKNIRNEINQFIEDSENENKIINRKGNVSVEYKLSQKYQRTLNEFEGNVDDNGLDRPKNNENCNLKSEESEECFCCSCQINSMSLKNQLMIEKQSYSYCCLKCNKKFYNSERLAKHACFLSDGEVFRCSCFQTFPTASAFKSHVQGKPYSCCSCSMQFNMITNLIKHIRTHTKQKPYVCKDCGRRFSQSAHLRNHSSIHLGIRAVQCNECNFSCKTFSGLLKHKKKHEGGFLNQNYVDGRKKSTNASTCSICSKQFLFKRNMSMHMKIHNNKDSLCTECGKVFDSKRKLTSHYKACHREPSVCKTCGKVFASAVLLSTHEKIHVSHKLFSCTICQKSFSIKNYLVQHMKTHSDKKQFSCSQCGKLFKVAVSLKYHSNICTSLNISV